MSEIYTIEEYTEKYADEWNEFVAVSKNGTFLFNRSYMDYHSDRFEDMSLMIRNRKGRIVALLPSNRRGETLYSHQGLTYGGFIIGDDMTAEHFLSIFNNVQTYLVDKGLKKLIYKPVPHIYHKQPAEEELYALYRSNATLISRGISTTINLRNPLKMIINRSRKVRRAESAGLNVRCTDDFTGFFKILTINLQHAHNVCPVHSLDELQLLKSRFPEQIILFEAVRDDEVFGGVLVYIFDRVVHTQYMSANEEGKKLGAIDFIIAHLIDLCRGKYDYLDFGISTELSGRYLNTGLIYQKEGFGGRATVYDAYEIRLKPRPEVELVEFDDRFVARSTDWLQDSELRRLINLPTFDIEAQKRWVKFFRSNPDKTIVRGLMINGNMAGACGVKHIETLDDGTKTGEYWGYIGEKALRGKGAGHQMMDAVENLAKEAGISVLVLNVMRFNERALALYKSKGFREVKGTDEVLMCKDLKL